MHSMIHWRRRIALLLVLTMVFAAVFPTLVSASMVETGEMVSGQQTELDRQALLDKLNDEDMKQAMEQMGVSEAEMENRINSLTAEELAEFEQQLAAAPAGEGVLGAVVLIFILFIVTDMLCATDLFPFVRCIK